MVRIRSLRPSDDLELITAMLHRAYAGLADMGFRFLATHQSVEVTRSRMNGNLSYVAVLDGTIVGAISLYNKPYEDVCVHYRNPRVVRFGQFGIEPSLQRSGLGTRMMDHVESVAKGLGFREIACDTAEGATHLVEWYIRRGYQFVEQVQWDVTNYKSVVLSKKLIV